MGCSRRTCPLEELGARCGSARTATGMGQASSDRLAAVRNPPGATRTGCRHLWVWAGETSQREESAAAQEVRVGG